MARRPLDHHAICWALAAEAVATGTSERTRSGNMAPHSRTCIPPMEPPTTLSQLPTPRVPARAASMRTMSRTDTTGKSAP
jgi:hypothetical protein